MGKFSFILCNPPSKDAEEGVFVDFENAQPTELEQDTYCKVADVLLQAKVILKGMQSYGGCMPEIREAINNPSNGDAQNCAWDSVQKHAEKLKSYYNFSKKLETIVTLLLTDLTSGNMTSMEHLEQQQALFRQFAEVLDFTLSFDEAKMATPSAQNDISYYRRRANQLKVQATDKQFDITIEVQDKMSLFFAESRPMMKCVSDAASRFVTKHKHASIENTTETLAKMASICRVMITTSEYRERLASSETILFIVRVMVGVLILYDHVHPSGAFIKNANIEMDKYVRVLKQHAAETSMLDTLKYTSKHFWDRTTPDSIKKIFY